METTVHIENVEVDGDVMECIVFGTGARNLAIFPGLSLLSLVPAAPFIEQQFAAFLDDFTVYIVDRRKNIPDDYDFEHMARDYAAALDALSVGRCCLYATSEGGMAALVFAALFPERVEKLALASVAAKSNAKLEQSLDELVEIAKARDLAAMVDVMFEKQYSPEYGKAHAASLGVMLNVATEEDLDRFVRQAECMRDLDVNDSARAISCPVLCIIPGADKTLPVECQWALVETIPDCTHKFYEGAAHCVYDEDPDVLVTLKGFLG